MARRYYVCRKCRMFTSEKKCPMCHSTDLSVSWKGLAVIIDPKSEIATALNVKNPGRYALFVD